MNLEDRLEIQEVVHRYAYFVDNFEIPEWVALFTADGTLDESEFGKGCYAGHDAIHAYGRAISERVLHLVHLMSNQIIWEINGDSARSTSFAIVESMSKAGDRARYQVKYEDEFRRQDGRWLIHKRMLRTSFPPEILSTAS